MLAHAVQCFAYHHEDLQSQSIIGPHRVSGFQFSFRQTTSQDLNLSYRFHMRNERREIAESAATRSLVTLIIENSRSATYL